MVHCCLAGAARIAVMLCAVLLLGGCRELSLVSAEEPLPVIGEKLQIPTQPNPHAFGIGPMPGDPDAIVAYLNRPERAIRGAVILLHGCQGLDLGTRLALVGWNEWWKAYGFATLVVDSLGPRQVDQACIGEDQQEKADITIRIRDAVVAAQYLQHLLGLPLERIGVQGFSHGGQTALELARATSPAFGWIIALYPGCTGEDPVARPTLVLTGEGDDWTSAEYCQDIARHDSRLKLVVLEHARHLFDQPLPDRLAFGHSVAYDPEALNRAKRSMRHFLRDLGALASAS
jgi:dienelactone hydrolase